MNNYKKLVVSLFLALLPLVHQAMAQDQVEATAFDEHINKLSRQVAKLSDQLAEKIKSIDTKEIARNAEQIAHASEQQAKKLANRLQASNWEDIDSPTDEGELWAGSNGIEQSKTIQKVYIISKNTPLAINNRYGAVEVKTWTKNEIKVDITIRAVEASGNKAQEIINSVSISENKSANSISLTTQIDQGKSSWWNNIVSSKNRGVQINYQVYLPASNQLAIENAYGTVTLPDLTGRVDLNVSYGSLAAGKLTGDKTSIHASYLSAKISAMKNAALNFEYGKLDLGEVDNLDLTIGYCGGSRIGNIMRSGKVKMEYSGGFQFGLGKSIHTFMLNSAYSASSITIDPASSFAYQVNVSYGGFNSGKTVITKEDPDPSSRGPKLHKRYTGYYGNESSANQVTIDSDYGSVKFD